jgi:hypothetical protein
VVGRDPDPNIRTQLEREHFPGVTTSAEVSRRSLPYRRSLRDHSEPKLPYWVTSSPGSWRSKHSDRVVDPANMVKPYVIVAA